MLSSRTALFDMDGLLLNTEIVYTEVTQQIVGKFGKTYDWSIKSNMIGRPAIDSARYLVGALDLPITAEQYLEQRNGLLRTAFANCDALPGAERLIRHLKAQSIPIAVATSAYQELFEIKTRNHKSWFNLFDTVVTGDDPEIGQGKPAPDIFLVAVKRLGGIASEALVFEDAPSGLQAGKAAGMQVVVVPDANMDKQRYSAADVILDSLEDFQPEQFGLPGFFKDNEA
ncbi:MAG: pseudouridine-5'-monophosphatase [Parasphingorhabdus sp.]|jgi:pseudouridine-5'-monophosphatase